MDEDLPNGWMTNEFRKDCGLTLQNILACSSILLNVKDVVVKELDFRKIYELETHYLHTLFIVGRKAVFHKKAYKYFEALTNKYFERMDVSSSKSIFF